MKARIGIVNILRSSVGHLKKQFVTWSDMDLFTVYQDAEVGALCDAGCVPDTSCLRARHPEKAAAW